MKQEKKYDNLEKKYGNYSLYSFDVFDTVITRTVSEPSGIFTIMQKYLENNFFNIDNMLPLICDFKNIRINYERYAYEHRKNGVEEITLNDIYQYIGDNYNLSDKIILQLQKLEEQVEYENSIPLDSIITEIQELIEWGKRVIFISDMYLPCDIIRKLLVKANKNFATMPIYVSSNYKKTKSHGNLYHIVKNRENVSYDKWIHIGDNEWSDQKIPMKLGIHVLPIKALKTTSFEKFLNRNLKYNAYAQILTGISRLARSEKENFLYQIGCNYGAPILVAYVEWILRKTQEHEIKKLYFIARDGYIIKKIADRIIKKRDLCVQTKYIYGSRMAWYVEDEKNKDMLQKYIYQEVDWNNNRIAFIDSFGSGGSINSMANIIKTDKNVKWFAFFLQCGEKKTHCLKKYDFIHFIDIWDNIELFCKAPEGGCIGYKSFGNKIVPVCDEKVTEKIKNFGFSSYEKGIRNFMKYYVNVNGDFLYNSSRIQDIMYWYFKKINEFPDVQLRKFLVEFPRDEEKNRNKKIYFLGRKTELKLKKIKYIIKELEKTKIFNILK